MPFGRYTGIEILDTLEVLGHERYQDILKKAGVLNEQFVDRRTRAVLRRNAEGDVVPVTETTTVQIPIAPIDGTGATATSVMTAPHGGAVIASMEDHAARADEQLARLHVNLVPRGDLPKVQIPLLKMTSVKSEFSLADITDLEPFRRLGERIAANPVDNLQRVVVSARIVVGSDGLRQTRLVTAPAADRVVSAAELFPIEDVRKRLIDHLLGSPVVPARSKEQRPAGEIVDAFLRGVGPEAEQILSGYLDRAAAGLLRHLEEKQRRFAVKPSYHEVVVLTDFDKVRVGRPETSQDRFGAFHKGVGYEGYRKSLYAQDWFDSSPERDVANLLEDEDDVVSWLRLQIGDVPILWSELREYNPDFLAIDEDDDRWLIEVKMDKEMTSAEVRGKREAARRWASHVSADDKVDTRWRYLLASEMDIRTAKGSWDALKRIAS